MAYIILILLLLITPLLFYFFFKNKEEGISPHLEIEETLEEKSYEETCNEYFDACIKKYLKHKFPKFVAYQVNCGELSPNYRTQKVGFDVLLEDGTHRYLNEYCSFIFKHIPEEDVKDQLEAYENQKLQKILAEILLLVEEKESENIHSFSFDISKLNEEEKEKLAQILLDEGLKTKENNNKFIIIIP